MGEIRFYCFAGCYNPTNDTQSFFTKAREVYGPGTEIMPVLIVIFGVFLVWFSAFGIKKSWLK